MKPQLKPELKQGDRAVSPVIGVILMVAITVILAAVIGAFVLEIGDQQETAPNASFDTEEEVLTWKSRTCCDAEISGPQTALTVAGGENLDVSSTHVTMDGSPNVWALQNGAVNRAGNSINNDHAIVETQPNVCEVLGTNEAAHWQSGETHYAMFSSNTEDYDQNLALPSADQYASQWQPAPADDKITEFPNAWGSSPTNACNEDVMVADGGQSDPSLKVRIEDPPGTLIGGAGFTLMATQDTSVGVLWTASSGGKSQRLFEYSVQQSAPFVN